MAVVSGTVVSVSSFRTPAGVKLDSSKNQVYTVDIGVTFTGTYAQADNAQVLAIPTAIQNAAKWGRACTLISAMFAAPGDEAGTPIGAKTVAVSGTGITCELTGGDLSTEHSGAALGTMGQPMFFSVCFSAPQT